MASCIKKQPAAFHSPHHRLPVSASYFSEICNVHIAFKPATIAYQHEQRAYLATRQAVLDGNFLPLFGCNNLTKCVHFQ